MNAPQSSSAKSFDTEPALLPILLVEDNLVNQKVTTLLLRYLSLECELASNGEEALEAVKSRPFSLILMDCHMPVMDGFESTLAIRKYEQQTGKYTPIIALTALSMAGDRERCIAAGMDDYIAKPLNKDILQKKINHWLRADVVYHSRTHARRYLRTDGVLTVVQGMPINIEELEEIYGHDEAYELLELYLDNTKILFQKIENYLAERNRQMLGQVAHEIKASSASIGAKQITKLALCLEQATGQEDWLEVEETYQAIKKFFQELESFVQPAVETT